MNKFVTVKEAADKIHDGMTVMVGGFLGVGNPIALIDELVARNVKDLTIICNDTAYPEVGVGKLITNHQVKALIATHIGTNNNTIDQMNAGELKVTLQPQGTLAEQIRAAGAGLGGVLTQTGLGTVVENGKQKITVDGKEYLLEKPVRADIAKEMKHVGAVDEVSAIVCVLGAHTNAEHRCNCHNCSFIF